MATKPWKEIKEDAPAKAYDELPVPPPLPKAPPMPSKAPTLNAPPEVDHRASIAAWLRAYDNTHSCESAEQRSFRMRLADEIEAKWDLKGK